MRAEASIRPVWPIGPTAPLPRTVTPFRAETVQSYLDRLAHANHLEPRQLRRYLADGPAICRPRPDWLATVSSQPVASLQARLIGLANRDRDPTRQRRHARPACRLCMARRGVYEPVYCWLPDYATVCRRHRRWIGPGTYTLEDQRDLHCTPLVLAAAQHHARLHRRHNGTARFAVKDAARIRRWWARSTSPSELPPDDVDTHIAAYPDLIALAAILADARVRIWNSVAATPARTRVVDAVYVSIGRRFPQRRDHTRPIEQWIHDQQLSAVRRAHNANRADPTTSR
ncbi:TniQ family protein [Mycolicibacter sp. MYC123]|uniref:TniQ domain-containing protein n=4 Tax=Mycolicibacter TaxID=1073531 RepID=A0A9X7IJW9_9MYCO|nr:MULTISPECIES: TniQ family protein [Mycobacteriaceae]MEB3050345.1 TniQ family protein [Mycolicibacter sp. MYC123]PQM50443.1 hypothetical protein C5U48_20125 [Mycolicibacter virginiensis]TXI55221.1 MAG: hypothetical protein E6Q54_12945 [Mycolicibacter arupensis]